ncbi:PfkB family carbohydrate kinase [Geodermatophilus sp. SYSU D00779]
MRRRTTRPATRCWPGPTWCAPTPPRRGSSPVGTCPGWTTPGTWRPSCSPPGRGWSLGVGEECDLVAWRAGPRFGVAAEELEVDPGWADGDVLVPSLGEEPVDPTGGGDAYVATLVATLLGGAPPEDAAWAASAAAALTVAHAGGRPQLDPGALGDVVRRVRRR